MFRDLDRSKDKGHFSRDEQRQNEPPSPEMKQLLVVYDDTVFIAINSEGEKQNVKTAASIIR